MIRRWVVPSLAVGQGRGLGSGDDKEVHSHLFLVYLAGKQLGRVGGDQKAAAGACLSLSNPGPSSAGKLE